MKTSLERTEFLQNLACFAETEMNPSLTIESWERFLKEINEGNYIGQNVSGYSRQRRNYFGMPYRFEVDFEEAKMLAPIMNKDKTAIVLNFEDFHFQNHQYTFPLSAFKIRRFSFSKNEANSGIYLVEKGQNWQDKWRKEREILIVPDYDF